MVLKKMDALLSLLIDWDGDLVFIKRWFIFVLHGVATPYAIGSNWPDLAR